MLLPRTVETDVLVVGSEAAGARAAIEAAERGANVMLITKSVMAKSGVTLKATFSCNAAFGYADPRDNPDEHFRDTVIGGRLLNNQRLVEIFTSEAPGRLDELGKWGMRWDMQDGRYKQTKMYGHSHARSLSVGFRVGLEMAKVLRWQVSRRPRIKLLNDVFVSSYLLSPSRSITGCTAIDIKTGEFFVIKARAIVDATGGAMHLFRINAGTPESTGDGLAMAFRSGAELIDMEFIQFVLSLVNPISLRGYGALAAFGKSWIRGRLYNLFGERFMRSYAPDRMELADRDVMARAIFNEIREGRGTPSGGVWLDSTFLADKIIETRIQQLAPNWVFRGLNLLDYGLDLRRVPLEVGPAAHFFCGGIRVDEGWRTHIPGLFAAGEVAGGVNGANRLPGNALPEALVSGAIAGRGAAEFAGSNESMSPDEVQTKREYDRVHDILARPKGPRPFELRKRLQDIMWDKVGVIRDEKGLKEALGEIAKMKQEASHLSPASSSKTYNREWIEALEVENMLDVAKIIATAALSRTETRGNHWRADYPNTSKDWLKSNVIKSRKGEIRVDAVPVVVTKLAPEALE